MLSYGEISFRCKAHELEYHYNHSFHKIVMYEVYI
jgi:hypothetical protein